jgi:hypothetical protein
MELDNVSFDHGASCGPVGDGRLSSNQFCCRTGQLTDESSTWLSKDLLQRQTLNNFKICIQNRLLVMG